MSHKTLLCAAVLFLFLAFPAAGGEGLTSTSDMVFDAVESRDGISLAPTSAADAPLLYTEGYAPPQVLELRRPDGQPLRVGRLITSCTCIVASMEKREFAAGEPAFVTVRAVKQPPVAGAKYAVIVQVLSPVEVMVQYNVEVR
ncbi:MAG: DUF1573 domain-containing protein [Planctomycetaceae bacterium]|nr:DUF1573 domain-containing protein [Planctomycetaceae bacterium]